MQILLGKHTASSNLYHHRNMKIDRARVEYEKLFGVRGSKFLMRKPLLNAQVSLKVPLIVRLEGTNVDIGKNILKVHPAPV